MVYRLRPHGDRPATLGEDFTDPSSTPGLLTFPANVTSANIVINITQDQIDEERERFRVDLVPLAEGTITEGKNSRVVLVKDEHLENDPYRPTASLQLVSSGPVPENEGPVEFAIVLDRVWGREGRYEVEVLPDQLTATPGLALIGKKGDFEYPGIVIARIPAGQTRFEFSVPLYDDDVREEDETFQLQLSSSYDDSYRTIGAANRALATIADDDRVPPAEAVLSLSHNGSALESVPEGSTQQDITVTASFPRIRWPGDASNAPLRPADPRDVDTTVRVQFDPNSGTTHAAGLGDFAPFKVEDDQGAFQEVESFDIAIPAGKTSGTATLRFRPVNDDVDEEDETVTLLGSELVAGDPEDSLPVRSASFTIIDDDTRGITVSPSSALSGLSLVEGGEPGTYSLVLDSQPIDTVVITLAGNQGGFLRIVPDSITFTTSDWATPQTVSVMALDDGIASGVPPTNFVTHQVSGGDYGSETVPDISANIEDTTEAFVYLEGGQASESDGHVEFTVTVRPILRTTPVLVRYATLDGTAMAGSDYTREVETGQTYKILNIPAGRSSGTIRIPIIDDQVYESADETFTLQLTNHNNKATLDGGATSLTATGAIADDDPKPVVSVAGPAGDMSYVSENAKDPVTFTLALIGQSAGDVSVDYATGEAGLVDLLTARQGLIGATEDEDYAGISGTVTFTSGETTKTVTVQVTNDDVSEDTEFFGFKISAPQGADLRGQRSEDVADVGLLDDDPRGVTIDPISIGLDEPASGETAVAGSYTVHLNSRPTGTVIVTVGGSAPAVSLSGETLTNNQLTFTSTNWNTAQTVTVTPAKDDNAAGETIILTHTLSGGDYAGIAADSVTVNLTDSDTRNIVLSKESLTVTEGDATGDRYTVMMATQPSDTVTVTISGHEGADLTLSGTTLTSNQLTFTTTNWDTAQTVTVKAGDDDNADNESETLTHTASGGDYVNVAKDLPVSITDDGDVQVTVSFGAGAYTVPEGGTQSVRVTLSVDPERTVEIPLTATDQGTATPADYIVPDSVTFDAGEIEQTITFTAMDDSVDDDGKSVLLAFGPSLPTGVSLGTTGQATVSIDDDDEAGIALSEAALSLEEGDATGASYTVKLATQPTGNVTVTISGHAGTDLSLSGTTLSSDMLTFTVDDWNTAQTVTVRAGQDADGANDTGTLTHTASGGGYVNVTKDLPVAVTDDDQAGIVLSETDLTVTEEDAAGSSYTVRLATQPTGNVTVTISGHAGTDLSLSGTTLSSDMLTFTVDDWNTAQTVTVRAGQDADGANDTGTLTHTASGGGYVNVTKDLPVAVTDDDQAGIVLSETDLTVTEGDAAGASYTVRLATRPTGNVTVTISGHAGTDLSLSGTTLSSDMLTFTVDDWNTAQTVTVRAGQDADGANDTGTLTHTASGGGYASVTKDLPVSITDDDEAGIVLSETDLTVTEEDAAGSSYTVRLAIQPTGNVTVTISGHAGTDLSLSGTTLSSDMLTFTVDDWNTAQTVTVRAGQDADGANDTGTLTHTASGGGYVNVTKDLPVSITDDDQAGVAVSFDRASYRVLEGDAVTVGVTLSGDPKRTVVIHLVATQEGGASSEDYSGVPSSVTINEGETSTSFNFIATQDDVDETCECVLLTFGALPSGVSPGPTDEAKVSIIDNAMHNGPPTVPPGPFGLTAYGDDQALYVRWETPAAEDQRAPVSSYRMRYRQVGASSWRNVSRANDGLTLWENLTGLTNRRAYEVQVAAVNRMGTGAWVSVKGTPQAPYAPPPGPEGDEAFEVGRLRIYWLDPNADHTNVLHRESCTGSAGFRAFWNGPDGNRRADEWAVHINTRGGAGEVSYSFDESSGTPDGHYFSMSGTVNFEGVGALSLGVRGRFGSTWGTWWSPPVSLYCHEPEAPADTCSLQVQQQAVENTPAEGEPRIDGIPEVGQTLSADTTAIADADGLNDVVFNYHWMSDDADIPGSTESTYTVVSGDVGQAISVRVAFTDNGGNEETLTSAPIVVTAAGLLLRSATVDRGILTLTYSKDLDTGVTLGTAPFAVNVNGSSRSLSGVAVGQSNVLLLLSSAVEAGDTVTVEYTVPDGPDFIRDIRGRKAASFSGQAVTNSTVEDQEDTARGTEDADTDPEYASAVVEPPLTATIHDAPASHDGSAAFTFELEFSEELAPDFSYTTMRDDGFTVTGGRVTYVRRLNPPSNIGWEVHVTPDGNGEVTLSLRSTTDCSAQGAICTGEGRKLSGGLQLAVAGPNTPATGAPSITGTVRVGETLTAGTTDISDGDGLGNAVFAYQWLAADAEINGATASTYTLADDDQGKTIRVRVSFADDAGNNEMLTSAATGAVDAAPPPPNTPATGAPSITGTVRVGETLTAGTTDISDGDGLGSSVFAYQWLAADAEINGATASTYTLADDDQGKTIRVRVSFADDAGNNEMLTSAATGAVDAAPPPPNTPATGAPSITGTVRVGETLTAGTADISDGDGLGNAAFAYQWLAGDADINGATASTYTLADDDEGKTIRVRVSFADDAGNNEMLTSAATGAVDAAPPPPNTPATGAPTISGTAWVSETLTASTTDISDADGMTRATFSYQWLAGDANISGATDSSYTLADADAGKAIKVRVSFTDDGENGEELTSAATSAVDVAPPPPNTPATGAPTISGTVQVGETLTVSISGIADTDGLANVSYSYQWIRNDGSTDTDIQDAAGSSNTLVDADAGKTITVQVTFTDDAGNEEILTSAATAAVEARPNTPATGAPTVSGTVQVGEALTANTSGIVDSDGTTNASYSYQWIRNDGSTDTVIQDATGSGYTLVDADEGKTIKVKVSFTDDAGHEETLTSTATASVEARANSPATGAPTISGTVQVRETLTASPSGIADTDGLTNVSYSYQWTRNDGSTDTDIQDATGSGYTLIDADEGKTIKVQVTFTDDAGHEETLTSTATASVEARPNSPATGAPTISGTVQVRETLTASTSGIADTDGLTNVSYSYQWIRNDGSADTDIQDAAGSSYTLVDADAGKTIKVKVSFTDDAGNEETLTSAATASVAGAPEPITVTLENNPASHNGTDEFTFQIRFSEHFELSYKTLRDHALAVVGGTVKKAQRQVKGSNIGWTITVEPASNAHVEIVLPATTDCGATGAICTADGRKLSNSLDFTVVGPGE